MYLVFIRVRGLRGSTYSSSTCMGLKVIANDDNDSFMHFTHQALVQICTYRVTSSHVLTINLTNRSFHVAVRLFSNRSQMTSKCGKNKKVVHEAQPSVSLMFLPHFDVLCDLLLNRRTATWNLFVLYNKKIKIHGKKCPFISNFATLTDTKIALT